MPTLEITTKLGCALACSFCPQDRLVKSYPRDATRMLPLANFRQVVAKLPAHVRIDFSGMSEPWLNPDATAMVVHAFEQGRQVAIYTTLQGMPPGDAALLIGRFADRIGPETPWVIHLPDEDGAMAGWRLSEDYLSTLGQFVALRRDKLPPGLMFMTMSRSGRVAPALQSLFPEGLGGFTGISRVENLDREDFSPGRLLASVHHRGAVLCGSTPYFDHNTMLPNGDVVLCCMDYARRHVLGNLLQQDYAALFQGNAMSAIRTRAMTPDDPDTLICRQCHNAVCLSQQGETHWQLQTGALWTARLERRSSA
jgi:Iron-sulfur cluster-binding domain